MNYLYKVFQKDNDRHSPCHLQMMMPGAEECFCVHSLGEEEEVVQVWKGTAWEG